MRNMTLIGLGFLFTILSLACKTDPTTDTPGNIIGSNTLITETRSLAAFQSVELNTVATVRIASGATQQVSITVNDNILQYVNTFVSGGNLVIDTQPGIQFSNLNLAVNLTMTDLEILTLNGAGSITVDKGFTVDSAAFRINGAGTITVDIEASQLNSNMTGAGQIILKGGATNLVVEISGAGDTHAFDLIAEIATVLLSGAGDAEVTVNQVLNATITGTGSVYYKGSPTINATITGTGAVVDAN